LVEARYVVFTRSSKRLANF